MTSAEITRRAASLSTPLPSCAVLSAGGQVAGQLDQLVVEEGHPALQAPRHRHVVDALDRVVHQHHGRVEPQRAVDARRGACTGEVLGDELSAGIPVGAVWSATYRLRDVSRCDERRDALTVAVEERLAVAGHRAVDGGGVGLTHRGIPVVAGEHLVGAPCPDCTTLTCLATSWLSR